MYSWVQISRYVTQLSVHLEWSVERHRSRCWSITVHLNGRQFTSLCERASGSRVKTSIYQHSTYQFDPRSPWQPRNPCSINPVRRLARNPIGSSTGLHAASVGSGARERRTGEPTQDLLSCNETRQCNRSERDKILDESKTKKYRDLWIAY